MGEMERRVFRRVPLLVALLASGAGVSCGAGLHDGDERQSTKLTVGRTGGHIDFMGASLDVAEGSLAEDIDITFSWHHKIDYAGALSGVYEIEVSAADPFQKDPTITIDTTREIAGSKHNVIGSMVAPEPGVWVPNTSKSEACPNLTVCGPVQSQIFQSTQVLRLAIVTECYAGQATSCPSGQSCAVANACQECPPNSPCK